MIKKSWQRIFRMTAGAGLALLLLIAWLQFAAAQTGQVAPAGDLPAAPSSGPQISSLVGAYYDAVHDDLVILGYYDPAYPVISPDQIQQYLATALRARYNGYPTYYPGMTIEFGPQPAPDQLPVFYYGLITDTLTGKWMFGSDRLLKVYSLGQDNLNPGPAYTSNVPGYMSVPDRRVALQDTYMGRVDPQRFFFTPDINLRLTGDQMGAVFSDTHVTLNWAYIPENTPYTSPKASQAAQGFVDHFNQHYDAFAQEQLQRNDPSLANLVQLFKFNGLAKWVYDKGIDQYLPGANEVWLGDYPIDYTPTVRSTPGITVTRVYYVNGQPYEYHISIYGGVDGGPDNTYHDNNPEAIALINAASSYRGDNDYWDFPLPEQYGPYRPEWVETGSGVYSPQQVLQGYAVAIHLAKARLVNGGFESGYPWAPWVESSTGGFELIDSGSPYDGHYHAFLGAYPGGIDQLYQEVNLPNETPIKLSYAWGIWTATGIPVEGKPRASARDLLPGLTDRTAWEQPAVSTADGDRCYVQIVDAQGIVHTLRTFTGQDDDSYWHYSGHSLNAFAGQKIKIRFHCETDLQSPSLAMYLDNVRIDYADFVPPVVSSVALHPAAPVYQGEREFEIVFSEPMNRFQPLNVQMGVQPPYNAYGLTPKTGAGCTNGFLDSDPTRWFGVYTFDTPMPAGLYHLSIADGEDTWHNLMQPNTVYTFLADPSVRKPGTFDKSSPAKGAMEQPTNPTLSWTASSGASSFEYCIDRTGNNTCDGEAWHTVTAGTSIGLSGLRSRSTYYWQVRARNLAGVVESSGGWWEFTTEGEATGVSVYLPVAVK